MRQIVQTAQLVSICFSKTASHAHINVYNAKRINLAQIVTHIITSIQQQMHASLVLQIIVNYAIQIQQYVKAVHWHIHYRMEFVIHAVLIV